MVLLYGCTERHAVGCKSNLLGWKKNKISSKRNRVQAGGRLQCVFQHSNMENPTLAESLEQQLQELRKNEQRILRVLQDLQGSVDQLSQQTADASWTAYTQEHKNQLQHLRYVRVLRAKEAGPLPCGLTPAEVEALLQCERGAVRHVEPQRDNAKGKQRVTVRFSSAEAATAAYNSFQRGNNTTNAVLDLRRTRLQNTLVDLAIQIQRVARGECGWGDVAARCKRHTRDVRLGIVYLYESLHNSHCN